MIRYTAQKPQVYRHASGTTFSFLMSTSKREEYRTIQAAKVPASAIKKDPITNVPAMNFDALPEELRAQMNMDHIFLPAYCMTGATGLVDEDGQPIDVATLDCETKADILLCACDLDDDFKPWLHKLLPEPEKKAAPMDTGEQLVGAEDVHGLPTSTDST